VIKGMALSHRVQVFGGSRKQEFLRQWQTRTSREILYTLLCTFYITPHSAILA